MSGKRENSDFPLQDVKTLWRKLFFHGPQFLELGVCCQRSKVGSEAKFWSAQSFRPFSSFLLDDGLSLFLFLFLPPPIPPPGRHLVQPEQGHPEEEPQGPANTIQGIIQVVQQVLVSLLNLCKRKISLSTTVYFVTCGTLFVTISWHKKSELPHIIMPKCSVDKFCVCVTAANYLQDFEGDLLESVNCFLAV